MKKCLTVDDAGTA